MFNQHLQLPFSLYYISVKYISYEDINKYKQNLEIKSIKSTQAITPSITTTNTSISSLAQQEEQNSLIIKSDVYGDDDDDQQLQQQESTKLLIQQTSNHM